MNDQNLTTQQSDALPLDIDIPTGINTRAGNMAAMLFDTKYFVQLQRVASMFSKSALVPKHYQNVADCSVAIHMAYAAGIDPLFLLQNTQVVHGVPGWKGQAIIALINNSKRFAKRLNWEFKRDDKGDVVCATCYTHDEDGDRLEASVTWDMVTAEGWNKDKQFRSGNGVQRSKWNTIREQMFVYRSATFFARRYCSDILLGLATEDEREDIVASTPSPKEVFGKTSKAAALNAMAEKEEKEGDVSDAVDVVEDEPSKEEDTAQADEPKGEESTKDAPPDIEEKPKGPLSPSEANDIFSSY